MASKKGNKIIVKMEYKDPSDSSKTYYYTKAKNTKSENTQGKMQMRKYNPRTRTHVVFTETKMPK